MKLSQDRLRRTFQIPHKISLPGSLRIIENEHHRELSTVHKVTRRLCNRTTMWAIWHAQTDEQVARSMTKWAQNHNESDLTRTNDQRVARAQVRISPSTSTTMKSEAENVTDNVLPGFSLSLKYFTCPEMSLRHPKYSNCPKWWSASARPKNVTRRFQLFKTPPKIIHYCACHEKWPWRPPLISSHACRFVLATCTKYWAFRADEKVSDVPRVTNLLHLSPKTYTLQKQTRHARENACLRAHISRETSFENGRSKNFCAGTEPN